MPDRHSLRSISIAVPIKAACDGADGMLPPYLTHQYNYRNETRNTIFHSHETQYYDFNIYYQPVILWLDFCVQRFMEILQDIQYIFSDITHFISFILFVVVSILLCLRRA